MEMSIDLEEEKMENDELLTRIQELEKRIEVLERESINSVSAQLNKTEFEESRYQKVSREVKDKVAPQIPTNYNPPRQVVQSVEEPKKKFDFEERFGHNIMGIIASILIFVGMILFMSVVYQSLTDWLKVICMFGISSFV